MNDVDVLRRELLRMQKDICDLKREVFRLRPLSVKELALMLRRGRNYPRAMVKAGFTMPNGRASLNDAEQWLKANPEFRVRRSALSVVTGSSQED